MKKQSLILAAAAVAILSLAPAAMAQAAVSTTSATTTFTPGIISEFSPETIVIRSESAPAPIRYSYTKTTTYVDETGAPVSMDIIKSGLPVKVYYIKEGDRMIANRVVVTRKKTSTTTTGGTATTEKRTTTTAPAPVAEKKSSTTTTTTTSPK